MIQFSMKNSTIFVKDKEEGLFTFAIFALDVIRNFVYNFGFKVFKSLEKFA